VNSHRAKLVLGSGGLIVSVALTGCASGHGADSVSAAGVQPANQSAVTRSDQTLARHPHQLGAEKAGLVPADSKYPAAGACASPHEHIVTVLIQPDTPAPRCTFVGASQALRVVNRTGAFNQPGRRISVSFARESTATLAIGQAALYRRPF